MTDRLRRRPRPQLDRAGHWLKGVRRVPSPNCDERPAGSGISLVVIHGISLPPGEYGGGHVDRLFTNTLDASAHPYFAKVCGLRVSAHLFVDRRGRITQYVPFQLRAWHAGESSFDGRAACNDFSIGIELEGCDEQPYEPRQYAVAASIVKALMGRWPAIGARNVVGHSDVAPGRKTDPGPAFDWSDFRGRLS
jgi:AmpD protein